MTTTLLIRKDSMSETRLRTNDETPLEPGEIRVCIDRLALTSNTLTYAVYGDRMNYWSYFPSHEAGWGIVPAWGFGSVVQSKHSEIHIGERLYGYWPLSSQAILRPTKISAEKFLDGSKHRPDSHVVYNRYLRSQADPFYKAETENLQALLRPLFNTAWLLNDFLSEQAFFGANRVLLSSASSKTSWATAYLLNQHPSLEVIGLTSEKNKDYCQKLNFFSKIVTYEKLTELDPRQPVAYVDFTGHAEYRQRVHQHFKNVKLDCAVGATHVEQLGVRAEESVPQTVSFFAPRHARKLRESCGLQVLQDRLGKSWSTFLSFVASSSPAILQTQLHRGPEETQEFYLCLRSGNVNPATGHLVDLNSGTI